MEKLTRQNVEKIRIKSNYVLILPDADHDEYQKGGKSTGLIVGHTKDNIGQTVAVKGTVYQVPEELVFNGQAIEALKSHNYDRIEAIQPEIDRLKETSVLYDVPMEVKVGDRVAFFYKNQFDCRKEGRIIDTELGEMLFMKYDTLYYTLDEKDEFKYMLNGFLLIDYDTEPEQRESGIYVLKVDDSQFQKKPKTGFAKLISAGCLVNGYIEFPGNRDGRHFDYDKVLYFNPRYANTMEFDLHQTTFEKKLYRIHRKDVFGFITDASEKITNFKEY